MMTVAQTRYTGHNGKPPALEALAACNWLTRQSGEQRWTCNPSRSAPRMPKQEVCAMSVTEWLREIAVWSPLPTLSWGPLAFSLDEIIAAQAEFLSERFAPEVFCLATVKLVARAWDTYPPYAVISDVLERLP